VSDHDHGDGPALDEEFWNERYQSSARIWSGNPNPQLISEACSRSDSQWLVRRLSLPPCRPPPQSTTLCGEERGAGHDGP
jgi:hypothetical protein